MRLFMSSQHKLFRSCKYPYHSVLLPGRLKVRQLVKCLVFVSICSGLIFWKVSAAVDLFSYSYLAAFRFQSMAAIEVETTTIHNIVIEEADFAIFNSTISPPVSRINSSHVKLSQVDPYRVFLPQPQDYIIIGRQRQHNGYLTIGIPTVCRRIVCHRYLSHTLSSLFAALGPSDRDSVTVLVFIADTDNHRRQALVNAVYAKFPEQLQFGLLQLVMINETIYPPLRGLKQNFKDNSDRVSWRAKQVMDFAYMFHYGSTLSKYYIQIEDDVITIPGFIDNIRNCIAEQGSWTVLEFSELGFIGKLFQSTDLARMARFFAMFYDEMPVDFLYTYFFRLLVQQSEAIHCKPSLFQHFGDHSSFANKKFNNLKDGSYPGGQNIKVHVPDSLLYGGNPSADVYSTLEQYENNRPIDAYQDAGQFFWAKTPKVNDTICILFKEPVAIDKVSIYTANENHLNDFLRKGVVSLSSEGSLNQNDKTAKDPSSTQRSCLCEPHVEIGQINERDFSVEGVFKKWKVKAKCIQVKVTASQEQWLLVRRIVVVPDKRTEE